MRGHSPTNPKEDNLRSSRTSYVDLSGEHESAAWRDEALRAEGSANIARVTKLSTPEAWLQRQAARSAQTTN